MNNKILIGGTEIPSKDYVDASITQGSDSLFLDFHSCTYTNPTHETRYILPVSEFKKYLNKKSAGKPFSIYFSLCYYYQEDDELVYTYKEDTVYPGAIYEDVTSTEGTYAFYISVGGGYFYQNDISVDTSNDIPLSLRTYEDHSNLKNDLTNPNYNHALTMFYPSLKAILDGAIIKSSTIPTPTALYLGRIYQYTGSTTSNFKNGYLYVCVSDDSPNPTYSWEQLDVQPRGHLEVQGTLRGLNDADKANAFVLDGSPFGLYTPSSVPQTFISWYVRADANHQPSQAVRETQAAPLLFLFVKNFSEAQAGDSLAYYLAITLQGASAGQLSIKRIYRTSNDNVDFAGVVGLGGSLLTNNNSVTQYITGSKVFNTYPQCNSSQYADPTNDYQFAPKKYVDSENDKRITQFTTMPEGDEPYVGKIVQYIGSTTQDYTQYYFYKCSRHGSEVITYSWDQIDVQPSSSLDTLVVSIVPDVEHGNYFNYTISSTDVDAIIAKKDSGEDFNLFVDMQAYPEYPDENSFMTPAIIHTIHTSGNPYYAIEFNTLESMYSITARYFAGLESGDPCSLYPIENLTYDSITHSVDDLSIDDQVPSARAVYLFGNDLLENIAPYYDDSLTYDLGDYTVYNGLLYVCTTAITVAEDWDDSHWTRTTVTEILGNLNSVLATLTTPSNGGGN